MFCENCGKNLPDGAKFCNVCGAKPEAGQSVYAAAAEPAPTRPVPPPPSYTPPTQTAPAYQHFYTPRPPAYSGQPGGEPLRVGQYIGMFFLMCVPILSLILLFVWSFGSSVNPNKKNFARAMLIVSVIGIVLSIIYRAILLNFVEGMFIGMGGYYQGRL